MMKLCVRFVLGLGLGSVAICPSLALDTHDLQKDCTSTLNGPQGYVLGYVAAVVEERAMSKSPTSSGSFDTPHTSFRPTETVQSSETQSCKYVDLHPEIWARSYHDGVTIAIDALYMNPEVKPTSSSK